MRLTDSAFDALLVSTSDVLKEESKQIRSKVWTTVTQKGRHSMHIAKKCLILSPLKKLNEENRNTDIVEDEISCSWKWIGINLRKLESVYLSWSLKGWWWGSW